MVTYFLRHVPGLTVAAAVVAAAAFTVMSTPVSGAGLVRLSILVLTLAVVVAIARTAARTLLRLAVATVAVGSLVVLAVALLMALGSVLTGSELSLPR